MQQIVLNYEIQLTKIPLFSFIKANYSYREITVGKELQQHCPK
jgi:hypothetical protein